MKELIKNISWDVEEEEIISFVDGFSEEEGQIIQSWKGRR